jgi:hypothetical protein
MAKKKCLWCNEKPARGTDQPASVVIGAPLRSFPATFCTLVCAGLFALRVAEAAYAHCDAHGWYGKTQGCPGCAQPVEAPAEETQP